jgi:hypothetical protein
LPLVWGPNRKCHTPRIRWVAQTAELPGRRSDEGECRADGLPMVVSEDRLGRVKGVSAPDDGVGVDVEGEVGCYDAEVVL